MLKITRAASKQNEKFVCHLIFILTKIQDKWQSNALVYKANFPQMTSYSQTEICSIVSFPFILYTKFIFRILEYYHISNIKISKIVTFINFLFYKIILWNIKLMIILYNCIENFPFSSNEDNIISEYLVRHLLDPY